MMLDMGREKTPDLEFTSIITIDIGKDYLLDQVALQRVHEIEPAHRKIPHVSACSPIITNTLHIHLL